MDLLERSVITVNYHFVPENRLESCKPLNWLTLSVIRVSVHVTVTSRMKSTQNFELFSAN